VPLIHHDLCFGCGRTNLFGLMLEATETAPGQLSGRAFIKQDHQGPDPGRAHLGVIAAALGEAMALAAGVDARLISLELEVIAAVPVGSFLEVQASADAGRTQASAHAGDRMIARASGYAEQVG
jgi:hypothetical protein